MNAKFPAPYLPEAIRRHNLLVEAIAAALPAIHAAIDGTPKTASGINKRTRDKINAALREHMPEGTAFRAFVQSAYNHAIYVEYDFNSPVSDCGVEYAKFELRIAVPNAVGDGWIKADHTPPGPVDLADIRAKMAAAEKAEQAAQAANDAAYEAIRACGVFASRN